MANMDFNNLTGLGTADKSIFDDMSRSVSRICDQMSLVNVNVPRFSSFKDVFDFLTEFETITSTHSDEQKLVLLTKAFPPGKHRAWFETELKPLIKEQKPWKDVKDVVIKRFSETENRDRHFLRLRELKFNPNGDQRLLDFVEDILYSYKKAYPQDTDQESKIRYVKASIPTSIKPSLSMIPEYQNAKTEDELKKGIKSYDVAQGNVSILKADDRIGISELASVLKEMMNGIKNEGEATRKTIVAALNTERPSSSYHHKDENYRRKEGQYRQDTRSPNRNDYHGHNRSPRTTSPNYRDNRQNSPRRREYQSAKQDSEVPIQVKDKNKSENSRQNDRIYDENSYFERFGKPPTPCGDCGFWHWNRHCIKYLN